MFSEFYVEFLVWEFAHHLKFTEKYVIQCNLFLCFQEMTNAVNRQRVLEILQSLKSTDDETLLQITNSMDENLARRVIDFGANYSNPTKKEKYSVKDQLKKIYLPSSIDFDYSLERSFSGYFQKLKGKMLIGPPPQNLFLALWGAFEAMAGLLIVAITHHFGTHKYADVVVQDIVVDSPHTRFPWN